MEDPVKRPRSVAEAIGEVIDDVIKRDPMLSVFYGGGVFPQFTSPDDDTEAEQPDTAPEGEP